MGQMTTLEHVGRRIQQLRDDFNNGEGISQQALARKLSVSPNTISRWETATYKPSIDDLEGVARFFGVSILTFFPADNSVPTDEPADALLRAARDLSPDDIEELRRYAEFRKARSMYRARPRAGRKRRE